ncbi:MAG: hypothetical protein ACFFCW_45415 [Candidatus Hodarchaeota archaeon]
MIELSVIRDLVAIFGVIAGLTYYVLIVRNSQRLRKMQIIFNWQQIMTHPENHRVWTNFVYHQNFSDYEDWLEKYGPINNPDAYVMMQATWASIRYTGTILQEGLVKADLIWKIIPLSWCILIYSKMRPLLLHWKEAFHDPHIGQLEDYLYNEARKQFPDVSLASELAKIPKET